MPKKEEALALGRFIVEDNSENMVEVSLAKRCHYKVARSVFKSLVGRVKIYSTDEEERIIWQKCNDVNKIRERSRENIREGGLINVFM